MDHVEPDFTMETARDAAQRDELADWVSRFLASPGSDNADLAQILGSDVSVWAGPMELRLDQLHRLAGPSGAPVMEVWDVDDWREDVAELAGHIAEGREPPPLVVTWRAGQLHLEDGNHRVEALLRNDRERAWAVVGFADEDDRDAFLRDTGTTIA